MQCIARKADLGTLCPRKSLRKSLTRSMDMLKAYPLDSISCLHWNVSFAFTSLLQHPHVHRLKRLSKRPHDAMPPLKAPPYSAHVNLQSLVRVKEGGRRSAEDVEGTEAWQRLGSPRAERFDPPAADPPNKSPIRPSGNSVHIRNYCVKLSRILSSTPLTGHFRVSTNFQPFSAIRSQRMRS